MIVTCISFSSGAEAWGADRSFVETLRLLRDRGVDCRVVLPSSEGMAHQLVTEAGFAVKVVPFKPCANKRSKRRPWKRHARNAYNVTAAIPLAAIARAWGSDVIYSNTVSIATGAIAAKMAHLPHVWHIRELVGDDHGWEFDFGADRMGRWLAKSAGVVANSRAVADKFALLSGSDKIRVVHNAVQLRSDAEDAVTESLGDSAVRCVISGRLASGKGQMEAVDAIAQLRHEGVKAGLWIVGDGDVHFRAKLDEAIVANHLTDCVKLVGYKKNPAGYLRAADVVLVCSRAEAFGRATVEGMLVGKPVIATASGGTPELISAGETGLLYPPGDVAALVGNIRTLAADESLRMAMGAAAKAYAEVAFTPQRYTDQLLDVLTTAAASRKNKNSVASDSSASVPASAGRVG